MKSDLLLDNSKSLLQLMHDTTTPVNTIKGSVNLLKTGTLNSEDTLKLLNVIEERANRVNEILDAYYKSQKEKL